jgi:hypothetical protein
VSTEIDERIYILHGGKKKTACGKKPKLTKTKKVEARRKPAERKKQNRTSKKTEQKKNHKSENPNIPYPGYSNAIPYPGYGIVIPYPREPSQPCCVPVRAAGSSPPVFFLPTAS